MPRRKYLDEAAPPDMTYNSVRPIMQNIQVKKKDTPARREQEARRYKQIREHQRVTPVNQRQASIGPYREKTAMDKAGGRLYAEANKMANDAKAREEVGVVLDALVKPLLPSTYVDMISAYKNGNVNDVSSLLASPYLNNTWSRQNPGKALAVDVLAPLSIRKAATIGNNIRHRNLFSYEYLEPFGYNNPLTRYKPVVSHILKDSKPPTKKLMENERDWETIMTNPIIKDRLKKDHRLKQKVFRDIAFRKYLGLPEPAPLYLPNNDGSFRYNLDFLRQFYENGELVAPTHKKMLTPISGEAKPLKGFSSVDTFTGNGGNVSVDVLPNNIHRLYDVWDINPLDDFSFGKFGEYLKGFDKIPVPVRNVLDKTVTPMIRKLNGRVLLGGKKDFVTKMDYPVKLVENTGLLKEFYPEFNYVDFSRIAKDGTIK